MLHLPAVKRFVSDCGARQQGFQAMLALTDVGARVEYLDQRGLLAIANLDEVDGDDSPVYRYRPA
jgi:hypothetical protein